MRLLHLAPIAALLSLTACDSAKLADLTGAKPAPPPACSPNPAPACAPGQTAQTVQIAPSMTPEADRNAPAEAQVKATAINPPVTRTISHRAMHRYSSHRHVGRHGWAQARPIIVRKVIIIHEHRYVRDEDHSRHVYVNRPEEPMYEDHYDQGERGGATSRDEGDDGYSYRQDRREDHDVRPPPVVYQRHYAPQPQDQGVVRHEQHGAGYGTSGSSYRQESRVMVAAPVDCHCLSPAAGRDRAGFLTWPGKSEAQR